ncbi:MAG: shufflon system plasmid conjugative transfer pilus tip adhesin PilV [Magnetospirillum sp.]|nr:shufflon system plasmid conjugative transfer pilus tip adhesin PilV [Magnetospirillum sp.]
MREIIGTLIAIAVGALALMWLAPAYIDAQTLQIYYTADTPLDDMSRACTAHLKNNYAGLLTTTQGAPVAVTPAMLVAASELYTGFVDNNAFGQQHICVINQPVAGQLAAMVYTYGGTTIPDSTLLKVAYAGPQNTFILLSRDAANFEPAGGSGAVPVAAYAVPGYPITPGHLAAFTEPAAYSAYSPYIVRYNTGNPEDATMHWPLNMGGNAITNAGLVSATDVSLLNNGGQLVSQGVFWKGLVSDGTVVNKPTCPPGTSPLLLLGQSNASDNGVGGAMSAIQTWAITAGNTWIVHQRVQTESGWVTPSPTYGNVVASTKCG